MMKVLLMLDFTLICHGVLRQSLIGHPMVIMSLFATATQVTCPTIDEVIALFGSLKCFLSL